MMPLAFHFCRLASVLRHLRLQNVGSVGQCCPHSVVKFVFIDHKVCVQAPFCAYATARIETAGVLGDYWKKKNDLETIYLRVYVNISAKRANVFIAGLLLLVFDVFVAAQHGSLTDTSRSKLVFHLF